MADNLFFTVLLYLALLPFLRKSAKAFIVAWTIPCTITVIYLVFAGGHPPGIAVIPIVLFVWFLGLIPIPFFNILKNRKSKRGPTLEENNDESERA